MVLLAVRKLDLNNDLANMGLSIRNIVDKANGDGDRFHYILFIRDTQTPSEEDCTTSVDCTYEEVLVFIKDLEDRLVV